MNSLALGVTVVVVRVEVVGKSGLSVRYHFLLPALGAMVVVVIYSRGPMAEVGLL